MATLIGLIAANIALRLCELIIWAGQAAGFWNNHDTVKRCIWIPESVEDWANYVNKLLMT